MDLTTSELVEVGLDLVELDRSELPPELSARVLVSAVGTRPVHPAAADEVLRRPLAAFSTTAAELSELLAGVAGDDWGRPTRIADASVRGLAAHLVGVERYLLGQLGRREAFDAPRREDHLPTSRLATKDLANATGEELARVWWSELLAVLRIFGDVGPDHPVMFHHLPTSVRGLLVVRTFELWTHGDDVRRALGWPLNELDDERLGLMSSELMSVLPLGMAMLGTTQPGRSARIELAGPGAGVYEVALAPGQPVGVADITITTTALDLCRFAANRLSLAELDAAVAGDASLLEPIMAGAAAFAAD
jgi:uncharacterized protein (TIGR03083 family)